MRCRLGPQDRGEVDLLPTGDDLPVERDHRRDVDDLPGRRGGGRPDAAEEASQHGAQVDRLTGRDLLTVDHHDRRVAGVGHRDLRMVGVGGPGVAQLSLDLGDPGRSVGELSLEVGDLGGRVGRAGNWRCLGHVRSFPSARRTYSRPFAGQEAVHVAVDDAEPGLGVDPVMDREVAWGPHLARRSPRPRRPSSRVRSPAPGARRPDLRAGSMRHLGDRSGCSRAVRT